MNFWKGMHIEFLHVYETDEELKKYLQQKFSRNVLVHETTRDFELKVCRIYVHL